MWSFMVSLGTQAKRCKPLFVFILVVATAFAAENFSNDNVSVVFDKNAYDIGDVAKIKIITKKRPANPDFQFIVVGTQSLDGVTSAMTFRQFNNIFTSVTRPLSKSSSINLTVRFENTRQIKEIDNLISDLRNEIEQLEDLYNRTQDAELLKQIQKLRHKVEALVNERSKQSIVVQKIHKVMNLNSGENGEETDNDVAYSDIIVSIEGIDETKFNPTELNIKLRTSSEVGFNHVPETYNFSINGEPIDVSNLSIQKNEVSFKIIGVEGENILQIEGLDESDQIFGLEKRFFVGSKAVSVNVHASAMAGTVTAYLTDNQNFKIVLPFTDSSFTLENVPDLPMVFDVMTNANEFSFATLPTGSNSVNLIVLPSEAPSTVQNDDFSRGVEGWNILSGTYEVVNRAVNGESLPDNSDLRISADDNSKIELRRTFIAQEADKFITLKFDLQTTGDDEEVHVVLRNETTNEWTHKVYLGKDHTVGPSLFFDISEMISVQAINVGDVISLHIKAIKRTGQKKGEKRSFDNLLPSGDIETDFYLTADSFSYKSRNIEGFYAHSLKSAVPVNQPPAYGTLENLSIGPIPDLTFNYRIPFNFQFKNILGTRITQVDLIVEQRGLTKETGNWAKGSWTPEPGEAEEISEFNNLRNDYKKTFIYHAFEKIKISQAQIAKFSDFETPLSLYLAIHLDNDEIHYAKLPRSLTPLEYRRDSVIKYMPDRNQDWGVGGDSWGQKFVWDFLIDIFNYEGSKGFKINDLSRLNGGHFNPHKSHRDGLDVDFNFNGYFSHNVGNTQRWLNQEAIPELLELISNMPVYQSDRLIQYVDKVFVSYETEKEKKVDEKWKSEPLVSLTDLKRHQRAGCSLDNRPTRSIIRHELGHVDHGHIVFKKKATLPLQREFFANFRPFFKRSEVDPFVFEFEAVSSEFQNGDQFIWDIRKASDNSMVEVIDAFTKENSPSTRGTLLSKNIKVSKFTYRFPQGPDKYKINLVVVRMFPESLWSLKLDERCLSQSFEMTVSSDNIVNCPGEWQTRRGHETVDPISGHKHLGGAIVSKDTNDNFEAGRFFVEDDTSAICGNSEIKDSYADSSGCTEENKYSCASILLKGMVGIYNSKIDASEGRVQIAGTEQTFAGHPPITPTDASGGIGFEETYTFISESSIIPNGETPIIIINSDIDGSDGQSTIKDSSLIQQSNVWWGTVAGTSKIRGATINGYKTDMPYEPLISITGNSEIKGLVESGSRLDIDNSQIIETGKVIGTGIVQDSLVRGIFRGTEINPSEFESTRIAKLVDSALLFGSTMTDKAQVLNQAVIGAEGETTGNGSLISGNTTVKNQAWVSGQSILSGDLVINGSKVKAFSVVAENSEIDSTVGGTKDFMVLNGVAMYGESKVFGTPAVKGIVAYSEISDDAILDGVQAVNARIRNNAELYSADVTAFNDTDKPQVTESAKVYNSGVHQAARMAGQSMLSDSSSLFGDAYLYGTAHVTNGCILSSGSYGSGVISPGELAPCEAAKKQSQEFSQNLERTLDKTYMDLSNKQISSIVNRMNAQNSIDRSKLSLIKNLKSRKARVASLAFQEGTISVLMKPRKRKTISIIQMLESERATRNSLRTKKL